MEAVKVRVPYLPGCFFQQVLPLFLHLSDDPQDQFVLLAPLSARWAFRELVWARKEVSINGGTRGRVDTHAEKEATKVERECVRDKALHTR